MKSQKEIKKIMEILIDDTNVGGVFAKKFTGIEHENTKFDSIKNFNQTLLENNNFKIENYKDYKELLEFFNIDFNNKNNIIKINKISNKFFNDNQLLTTKEIEKEENFKQLSSKNIIYLSNPNSGKTRYIKDNFSKYPFYELNFSNPDNSFEFKEKLFYHNHQGQLIIGNIIKCIANGIFNPDIPHFIFADEIGQFQLNYIFGTTLKSIMKKEQRIDLNKLKIENNVNSNIKYKINILNNEDINEISFDEFIQLCKDIKNEYNTDYCFTTYTDNGINLDLFLPSNVYIVCSTNYEEGILESLEDSLGWNENGERFKTIHFYNFLNINTKVENTNIEIINGFNKQLQNIINNKLKIDNNEILSYETIKELKNNEYQLYISNYFKFQENEDKFEEMKSNLENKLNNMYIDDNDIQTILDNIQLKEVEIKD